MTVDKRKYLGWQLEGISLENELFTIRLVRYSLRGAANMSLASQHAQARIIFTSAKKIALSKVHSGAEVTDIQCNNNNAGNVLCDLKFFPDSSIAVTAAGIVDLLL